MRICLVAAEVAPYAKTGGLGDFTAALCRHLARAGHDVRLFFPAYGSIDRSRYEIGPVEFLVGVPVFLGHRRLEFDGLYTRLPDSDRQVYLIDCPQLYGGGYIYSDRIDEPVRFAFLCKAAIECCQRMGWSPDVFHCNDWHTALLPVYARESYQWDRLVNRTKSLLTIHNIGYQGVFGARTLQSIGLAEAAAMFPQEDLERDRINFLKTGILHSDLLTTVSPNHAREIQTDAFGMGLDGLMRRRSDRLVGILNGVDYGEWDPSSDPLIPFHYSVDNLRGKARNKRRLLKDTGLPFRGGTPLIGMVSRLVKQKGLDLLPEALPYLLDRHRIQLMVLGSGEHRYQTFFHQLQNHFSDQVFFYQGFNNELAHRIEAASDIYLMPSLYEPCGLNQMYSLRYGSVPIVRRTGGLVDSVQSWDANSGEGTGFVFDHFTPEGLVWAVERALELFADRPRWRRIVRNGMSRDFSWQRQVGKYLDLYRWLIDDG
ncbi:MAG: glycogen synthase [Acidobacteriota bacterium]